jgi:crotonobetainyl-CoA:carnitine CoA-transferase CaiB-like acyl-CoA transferase
MTDKSAGALDGVKVLDLCSYLAGPHGCTPLADLGADVIKIESPQGDMLRQFPSSLAGESRFFLGTNRGKRALALDLKQPEGLAVLHRMVASADVLVENFVLRCRRGSGSIIRDCERSIRASSTPG